MSPIYWSAVWGWPIKPSELSWIFAWKWNANSYLSQSQYNLSYISNPLSVVYCGGIMLCILGATQRRFERHLCIHKLLLNMMWCKSGKKQTRLECFFSLFLAKPNHLLICVYKSVHHSTLVSLWTHESLSNLCCVCWAIIWSICLANAEGDTKNSAININMHKISDLTFISVGHAGQSEASIQVMWPVLTNQRPVFITVLVFWCLLCVVAWRKENITYKRYAICRHLSISDWSKVAGNTFDSVCPVAGRYKLKYMMFKPWKLKPLSLKD